MDEESAGIQRCYVSFLEERYEPQVRGLIERRESRLLVNVNDLRDYDSQRTEALLAFAYREVCLFKQALNEAISGMTWNPKDSVYVKSREDFDIGFGGSFGLNKVNPRGLKADKLGKLVRVDAIVASCSDLKMRPIKTAYFSEETDERKTVIHTSAFDLQVGPFTSSVSLKDKEGNPFQQDYGASRYKTHQILVLQESPQSAPPGKMPTTVTARCEEDLVNLVKNGQKVTVVGIFHGFPEANYLKTKADLQTEILVTNIEKFQDGEVGLFTGDDVLNAKKFSKEDRVYILTKKN